MCASLGSRHCGQRTSAGADAFHWARRDLVLLRDILRLGTATSVLLSSLRRGRAVRSVVGQALREACPPRVDCGRMPVVSACPGELSAAFGAQSWAVVPAQRRERERQYQGVTKDRLEIEQVPD